MAIDTSVMEYTAEDLISHKLQRAGILVAKPKFDQEGADLLGLLDVKDNAKFCRIQCKGRTLRGGRTSEVKLPTGYATNGFVLFLYVETGDRETTHLFCYLGHEIRENWNPRDGLYVLSLTASKLIDELQPFVFNDSRIWDIKKAIISIDVGPEFNTMGHAYAELTAPMLTLSASGG